jgi:hypothetical protein
MANGQPVEFTSEAEHVGVLRNTSGNMPNIMNRIAEHKQGLKSSLASWEQRRIFGLLPAEV